MSFKLLELNVANLELWSDMVKFYFTFYFKNMYLIFNLCLILRSLSLSNAGIQNAKSSLFI